MSAYPKGRKRSPAARSMLRTALGPAIAARLGDPAVVEVLLNPTAGSGSTGWPTASPTPASGGRRPTASASTGSWRTRRRRSARSGAAGLGRAAETGERFEGLIPPVVAAPAFAIRKPAVAVFTLDDYMAAGIGRAGQGRRAASRAVAERRNILVAGGTSTGKTTLVNALLAEVARTGDRVVLIEDTRELQCTAPNLGALRTKDGVASLSELVRSSLRLRPDRIPIGEVRGAEALDLLKAWGTRPPGGIGTIHAGSALGAPAPPRAVDPGGRWSRCRGR